MTGRVRVMVVDDSALVREALRELLSADPELEVVAVAPDPFVAAERLRTCVPDVLVLDLEMPRMDGLTFLRKLMRQHPIPTVICSTLAIAGSAVALAALEAGAVELIAKPQLGTRHALEEQRLRICDTVKAAARARLDRRIPAVPPKLDAGAVLPRAPGARVVTREKVVVLGASTGGTEAIRTVLDRLPADAPGIAIVQHMPEGFTAQFAERLDRTAAIRVKEAAPGDALAPGLALIAPGNRHLALRRTGQRYFVEILDGPLVCRHRPSVDVLFRSAAQSAGANAVGVLLTGMGDDGARGLLELRQAGAATVAQDEATSVVFGMPHEAIKRGAAERVVPLSAVPAVLLGLAR